ncbi:MAG TPA: hypothetical protein VII62_09805, partial [Vicinamibacteria bacterium]
MTPRLNAKIAVASLVVVAIAFAATVGLVQWVLSREYRAPERSDQAQLTPRTQALADEAAAKAKADREKPYQEETYRRFPVVGSRVAVWVLAQLHLLFAAFVLAVPLFALIIEFIGWLNGDERYDELAHEFTKL